MSLFMILHCTVLTKGAIVARKTESFFGLLGIQTANQECCLSGHSSKLFFPYCGSFFFPFLSIFVLFLFRGRFKNDIFVQSAAFSPSFLLLLKLMITDKQRNLLDVESNPQPEECHTSTLPSPMLVFYVSFCVLWALVCGHGTRTYQAITDHAPKHDLAREVADGDNSR